MIPETRLKELLVSVHPDATRLPPGWLAFARLVEQEALAAARAEIQALEEALNDASEGRRRGRMSPT